MLLAYYGDDFTGSTDALESLASSGIETVLFVDPPGDEMLQKYPHVRAIGVAGNSRTMSPSEMETELPKAFHALEQRRPKILHYKVCSTFDSSPETGSIGRAVDIGHRIFQNRFVPLVVAAPALQRFCVFGNLFARSGLDSAVFRLDQHPTMRCHPVTPMTESDLRVHLARQTTRPIELVDVLALENGYDAASEQLCGVLHNNGSVVLFDALTDAHLATIGRLICTAQAEKQKTLFCSDLFHHVGDVEPLTESDIVGRSRDALVEYQKGPLANYLPYTPLTGQIMKRLGALRPTTLATMHGSSFRGDCERAFHDLASAFRDALGTG